MAAPIVKIRGLTKSFGDHTVLKGVDLDVCPAQNVVVLGRSGTGKSVLAKIVVGLLPPDDGTVEVFGQDVPTLAPRELDALRARIGFAFQHSALYDSMSVAENLAFPLRMSKSGLSRAEVRDKVAEALEAVGLPKTAEQLPAELSGGQRKRIGIARALMLEPELMLYDEPTAGLDPITSSAINDLVLEVRERTGAAAILITHDLTCARATGDRVAMLVDGQVHREGRFSEVFSSEDPRVRAFHDYNFIDEARP